MPPRKKQEQPQGEAPEVSEDVTGDVTDVTGDVTDVTGEARQKLDDVLYPKGGKMSGVMSTLRSRPLSERIPFIGAILALWRCLYGNTKVIRETPEGVDIGTLEGWVPIHATVRSDYVDITSAFALPGVGVVVRNYIQYGDAPPVVSLTFAPNGIVQPVKSGKAHEQEIVRYQVVRA